MTRTEAVTFLMKRPVEFAHLVGFTKLGELHNEWIRDMVYGEVDGTLQAHRGSYKTTCLTVAIPIIMLLFPDKRILFTRKTDNDVKEVIKQVTKIAKSDEYQVFADSIYKRDVGVVEENAMGLTLDVVSDNKGTAQLTGLGLGGSLTGKHYDRIFTDDIVNVQDRISKAERERTKLMYQELQNLKNVGGRIFNTGTPWHKEDAFTLMPEPKKYDCYTTGILSKEETETLKRKMSPSLFAANYELIHIASELALFTTPPQYTNQPELLRDGIAHVDAAYGGEDYTAFTCGRRSGDTIYMYGRMWHGHVDKEMGIIISECKRLMCSPIWCEDNGDKGYLAKEFRKQGIKSVTYHEDENKNLKISTYLRKWWENIVWLEGTDRDYINQIMDYTEDAEHDDAPDSASVMCRYWDSRNRQNYDSAFKA